MLIELRLTAHLFRVASGRVCLPFRPLRWEHPDNSAPLFKFIPYVFRARYNFVTLEQHMGADIRHPPRDACIMLVQTQLRNSFYSGTCPVRRATSHSSMSHVVGAGHSLSFTGEAVHVRSEQIG